MKGNVLRIFSCILVCAVMLSTIAYAAELPDFTEKCSVTLEFSYDDVPVAGAEFKLYRVGEIQREDGDYVLSLSGAYKKYPVQVNGLDDVQFQKAADTLAGYVGLNGHKPMKTVTTDAAGVAKLDKLDAGLYLMMGTPLTTEEGLYVVENQLIILPFAENTAGDWLYDLTITPKAEFEPAGPEPLQITVVKVWNDKHNGDIQRPVSVTVHLLRNGEKFETVVLSEETSWRHEWTDLDRSYSWSVAEDIPADYTVSINLQGTAFIITNTAKEPPPTPPPSPTPPPKIPQTGQLWWPVPVLMLIGMGLLAMGIIWRKEDRDA